MILYTTFWWNTNYKNIISLHTVQEHNHDFLAKAYNSAQLKQQFAIIGVKKKFKPRVYISKFLPQENRDNA